MINISEADKKTVFEYIQDASSYFDSSDVNGLLDAIYDRIAFGDDTFTTNHDVTEVGRKLERIYDRVLDENFGDKDG